MPFGIIDTRYIDLPANIDAAYVQGLQTRAGVNFAEVLRQIDARLGAFNSTIDPLVASLITVTDQTETDGSRPAPFKVSESGEYTLPRAQRVEGAMHPLPMRVWDAALGFTERGLMTMSMPKILLNVDSLLAGFKRLYRVQALKRLFSIAEVRVAPKTTSTNPGMAGSGTGLNVFSGTYPNGTPLPGGYTHYARVDQAGLKAQLKTALTQMQKWHGRGPFDLVADQAVIDIIVAFGAPDFVPTGSELVRVGSGSAEATVDPALYVGVLFGQIRVQYAADEITTDHLALFKSYGPLDPMNPLAWRFDPLFGRDAYIESRAFFPLDEAVLLQHFGIGTNNRVGAYLIKVSGAGGYTDPTIQ